MPAQDLGYAYAPRDLLEFAAAILGSVGVPHEPAVEVAEVLIDAEAGGNVTHGLMHLPLYAARLREGSVSATARPSVARDGGTVVVIDGGLGLGQVAAVEATRQVVARARRFGVAQAVVRRTTTFGPAGYYARRIAAAGAVALVLSNSSDTMAPFGGSRPTMSNSPFAVGVPCRPDPIVVDMACSRIARGTVDLARLLGDRLPDHAAVDRDGRPTTDPVAALDGALLPFGGHKGYALALVLDLITAGYAGSDPEPVGRRLPNRSQLFIACDVAQAEDPAGFAERVSRRLAAVLSSPAIDAFTSPRAPGAVSAGRRAAATQDGISPAPEVVAALQRLAREHGVPFPSPAPHMR